LFWTVILVTRDIAGQYSQANTPKCIVPTVYNVHIHICRSAARTKYSDILSFIFARNVYGSAYW